MITDRRGLRIGVLLLCGTAVSAAAQGAAPENSSIRADRLRADLMLLAGDGVRGRLTNTPENTLATEWIKSRFERLGLKPMGQGGSAPALGYDDLAGDVRGKILQVLDHEPGEADPASPFDGVVSSEAGNPLRKALAAQERGTPVVPLAGTVTLTTAVTRHIVADGAQIFNGADDDGSGTVGLLAIADAYAQAAANGKRPKRSISW